MSNFHIFVDETGSFSYFDAPRNCFVGGWVCREDRSYKKLTADLETILRDSVKAFNNGANIDGRLQYPKDMHFSPLHTPPSRREKNDRHIKVAPENVPPFFHDVFAKITPNTQLIFRSSGLPAVIPHEQAAYMEVLRNTLIQLMQNDLFSDESALRILIAQRRTSVLLGYGGSEEPLIYEEYLASQLKEELQAASGIDKITIRFGNALQNPGLMLADFFCGAMKRGKYLNGLKERAVTLPFTAGYRLIKMNIEEQLAYLRQHNPVAALMRGLQFYTGMTAKSDRRKSLNALREVYSGSTDDEKEHFQSTIRGYLEGNLTRKSTRYEFLDEAEAIITALRAILPKSPDDMSPTELRLRTDLGLHEIRIASHRGRVAKHLILEHIKFLHNHAGRSFQSRVEYLQHLIDTTLMVAQLQDFNQLRFAEVESTIRPVRELYHRVFEVLAPTAKHVLYDENHAKLEGTYAQMCGFLYDMTGEEKWFHEAEAGLLNDIASCRPGDHAWEQGMGFLTVLYLKKGDLEKARTQFCMEMKKAPTTDLYNLENGLPYDPHKKPFFLLHHLCLCALAQKKGQTVTGLDMIKRELLSTRRIAKYPEMLSAKWLAVQFMSTGDYDQALELLAAAGAVPPRGDDFTYAFIRLPIKMLAHKCRHALGEDSVFDLKKEVRRLEKQREGATELLNDLGLAQPTSDPAGWDPYTVAALPPYYYA